MAYALEKREASGSLYIRTRDSRGAAHSPGHPPEVDTGCPLHWRGHPHALDALCSWRRRQDRLRVGGHRRLSGSRAVRTTALVAAPVLGIALRLLRLVGICRAR